MERKNNFYLKSIFVLSILVFISFVFLGVVFANDYPSKPIKLIVPYNPGGATDTTARIIQHGLEKILPQPVVVINMGGAAGTIGSKEVVTAEPDGYTAVIIESANLWTAYALGNVDYNPDDFELVTQAGGFYLAETTGNDSRFKNLGDYLTAVKEMPNTVKEATNIGAITHFTSLRIQDALGGDAAFKLVHIGDGAQRLVNVLGGHVDATIMSTMEAKKHYDSGDMCILAVYAPERLDDMPDVPTSLEFGIDVGKSPICHIIAMPKNTPKDIIEIFADAVEKAFQIPETIEKMNNLMMIPFHAKGEELRKIVTEEGKTLLYIADKYNLKQTVTK